MPSEEQIWRQIDHKLASLKILEVTEKFECQSNQKLREVSRRNHGYLNPVSLHQIFTLKIAEMDKWAAVVNQIYAEVWQKQGNEKIPEFVRAVFNRVISRAIDNRKSSTLHFISRRVRIEGNPIINLKPHLEKFERDTNKLKGDWRRKIEIEAIEIEHSYHRGRDKVTPGERNNHESRVEPARPNSETTMRSETEKQKRRGRRKPDVARRRAAIRNAIVGGKQSHEDFCKRLDYEEIPIPDEWQKKYSVSTWQAAWDKGQKASGKDLRNDLDRMLSGDKHIILEREPELGDRIP